jgi:serine/threonine protein kinase
VLARAYRHIGVGTQKAAEVHERLWLLRPNDPRVTADTARLALQSGRMTDPAVQACQVWFDANPDHPDALAVAAHLGRAYRLRGAHAPRSALPALRAALDAAPNDRDLRAYLGALYSHHGEHAAAAEVLWPLVVADPHDQAARQELAHALIGQGRAYEAYRHLRLLPPSAELATDLYLAAVAADQAGRHQESLRILEEVIRLDPSLFDVEERVAAAAARVDRDRCGPLRLQETVAVHEAWVLRRAHHDDHGPVLALVFRREFSDALAFPDLFAERLPILSGLREGSAEVLAGGSHEEAYFVAYRPPAGQQLSELMDTRGLLAPVEAAEVMIPLLEALAALHAAGAVHGDLRPTSIWIEPGRRATLIGAGLAAVAEAAPGMTPPGGRSPFSVAPEVVQGYPCTPLADLYSAGCLLYELLVGSPPLEGPTHLATVMAQVTVEPEPPSMKVPAVPEGMDRLVMAALAKDPSYRVASAEDLADHLRAFVEQPRAPEAPAPPPTVPDATPSWGRTQSRPATPADPSRWWTFYDDTVLLAAARFAKVYRGVYRPTGEHHAIKHLQAPRPGASVSGVQAARAAEAVRRLFLNEIHLLQSLAEDPPPGVVRLAQAYRADERSPAYAMTLLGETLAQRVEQVGPLPEPEALALLREVGAALGALHQRGLVHRNLSPTSVLFAPDGRACLAGFDRACALADRGPMLLAEREAQSASHAPTDAIGDPRFLAPEQCRGEEFDVRTDVYSLGCLLYYLLTASAPFERSDPIQVMLDHLSSAPPRLRDWGLVVAPKTQELLDRALAKSPADRYPDVETMLRAW